MPSRTPRRALCALLASLCMITPALASAQDDVLVLSFSTTTYGGITTSGVGTTVLVVWLVMPKDKAKKSVAHYMNTHRTAVQEVLVTGHGEALADIATLCGVSSSHAAALGNGLARHRHTLRTLANVEVYQEQHAELFLDTLASVVLQDPTLEQALSATHNTSVN